MRSTSLTSNYKSYWKLGSDGTWIKPQSLEANAGEGNWKAEPLGNDGLTLISCGLAKINGEKKGKPLASVSGYGPEIREAMLSLAGMTIDQTTYTVELQITDIFNQQAKPTTALLEELKP